MGSEVEQTSCAAVESPDVHLFSLLDLTNTFVCMGFDGTQPPMQGIPSVLAREQRREKSLDSCSHLLVQVKESGMWWLTPASQLLGG